MDQNMIKTNLIQNMKYQTKTTTNEGKHCLEEMFLKRHLMNNVKKTFVFALLLIFPCIFYFSQTIKPNFLFIKSSINPMLEYFLTL
jgi:hypothetical protein